MVGRKRKPLEVQISEGDPGKIGKRKLEARRAQLPQAESGFVSCPAQLKGRARASWIFWVEQLEIMKIDRRPDAHMLEGACLAYARAVDADLDVAKNGITFQVKDLDKEGNIFVRTIKKNPAVDVSFRAWTQVKAFCCEFGFSPASRARLEVDKDRKGNGSGEADLAKLLSQPRVAKQSDVMNSKTTGNGLVQ